MAASKEKLRLFTTFGSQNSDTKPTKAAAGVEVPAAAGARPSPWTPLAMASARHGLHEEQLLIEQAAGLQDEAGLAPAVAPWFGLYAQGYRVR